MNFQIHHSGTITAVMIQTIPLSQTYRWPQPFAIKIQGARQSTLLIGEQNGRRGKREEEKRVADCAGNHLQVNAADAA
jgi:hypothetical protein